MPPRAVVVLTTELYHKAQVLVVDFKLCRQACFLDSAKRSYVGWVFQAKYIRCEILYFLIEPVQANLYNGISIIRKCDWKYNIEEPLEKIIIIQHNRHFFSIFFFSTSNKKVGCNEIFYCFQASQIFLVVSSFGFTQAKDINFE